MCYKPVTAIKTLLFQVEDIDFLETVTLNQTASTYDTLVFTVVLKDQYTEDAPELFLEAFAKKRIKQLQEQHEKMYSGQKIEVNLVTTTELVLDLQNCGEKVRAILQEEILYTDTNFIEILKKAVNIIFEEETEKVIDEMKAKSLEHYI